MTENKRFRVFKYPNCKEWGVSDDVTDCNYGRFDYHFEAETLCEILNELDSENKSLKQQLGSEHQMLDNAILLERTRMGQNALKQYKETIQ